VYIAYAGKYSSIFDFPLLTFSASRSCLFRKRMMEIERNHLNTTITIMAVTTTGWMQKVTPSATFVDISAKRANFCTKFMWLLNYQIHILSPRLVKINRKITKLCCFNQDNPHFSVLEHLTELTKCERVHYEDWVAQTLQIQTYWTITSGAPCWKSTINSSQRLRWLMSWKSPCRPSKYCHKKCQQGGGKLHQVPGCLHGCGCQWWSLQSYAVNYVRLQVCSLIS